ncbi:MAG: putative lipid II flippase FtsW [Christensenellaceae bacterium]|jgi:cell division protein FtsW|nr:putative lipid II flippase FtsW [Christensenellaceae bacterium]
MDKRRSLKTGQMDFWLYAAVLILCAFGLIMVFSASYYYAQNNEKLDYDGFYFMRHQAAYLAIGIVVMYVASRVNYHKLESLRGVALALVMLLMLLVVFIGVELNGAKRWLQLGPVQFQPSEMAKFALVLYMASFMAKRAAYMRDFKKGVVPMLIVMGVLCALLLVQRNMSMMMIVLLIGIAMLFIGGADIKHLMGLCFLTVPLFFLLAYIAPYRWARLTIFTDPWKDPLDKGYQLIQSLYALGSGGLFGKGLNFSTQKLLFLTYGESDFIFAIIGEELGLIGCVLLMLLYFFLICRGIRIAAKCKDRFGSLLAAGITTVIALQVAVNIGVVTSSVPPTGQTLPFVSSGGTSLVIFMAAVGVLLNISRNIGVE